MFLEYGDDSVAQLGGVHLACEQASNILTKVLEWGRLMAYLEQSTRYVPYDSRLSTGPLPLPPRPRGARVAGRGALRGRHGPHVRHLRARRSPSSRPGWPSASPSGAGDSDFVYRQSIRAKALDALRGLLPAASLSNVGVYGTGQSYEMLLLRMRAHPLPEARRYAELMLEELRKVIPSFLQRVDIPERGGVWTEYLADTAAQHRRGGGPPVARRPGRSGRGGVECERWWTGTPRARTRSSRPCAIPRTSLSDQEVLRRVRALGPEDRRSIMRAYVGDRTNRRHRPGRAFERTGYRFDVVSDYGAFRDLQRHRMLTIEWQDLGPALGYEMPDTVVEAGLGRPLRRARWRARPTSTTS